MKIYIVGTSIHYSKWIENSELVETPKEADIIMFTGGEDVDPSLYGDSLGKYTYINTVRDMYEKEIFYKYSDKFKIGICRGSQLSCILSGGKLIQHVTNHIGQHMIIDVDTGKKYIMSSTHHQMMYPYNLDKKDYKIIAHPPKIMSKVHWNGDNQNIKYPDNFVEPEIVWFNNTKTLAIQGHPEFYTTNNPELHSYLNKLIKKYIKHV